MHFTTTNAFQSIASSKHVSWAPLEGKSKSGLNPPTKDRHQMWAQWTHIHMQAHTHTYKSKYLLNGCLSVSPALNVDIIQV